MKTTAAFRRQQRELAGVTHEAPEVIVARVLASWRVDEPALVGPHERKVAAEVTASLRQSGWRILRAATGDEKLVKRLSDPVLRLWEALCDAGGMPAMRPEHARAMELALVSAWRQGLADALDNDG